MTDTPDELRALLAKAGKAYDSNDEWLDDAHGYIAADRKLAAYADYLPALLDRIAAQDARIAQLEAAIRLHAETL